MLLLKDERVILLRRFWDHKTIKCLILPSSPFKLLETLFWLCLMHLWFTLISTYPLDRYPEFYRTLKINGLWLVRNFKQCSESTFPNATISDQLKFEEDFLCRTSLRTVQKLTFGDFEYKDVDSLSPKYNPNTTQCGSTFTTMELIMKINLDNFVHLNILVIAMVLLGSNEWFYNRVSKWHLQDQLQTANVCVSK